MGEVVRHALVHVPPEYDASTPTPLVLVFHGGGGDKEEMRVFTEFDRAADSLGFIVVYPDGDPDWFADGAADRAFARDLIDRIGDRLWIDTDRVYATGFSNGGVFTMVLGCTESRHFAAIAPVAATMSEAVGAGCRPYRKVPTLLMLGAVDPLIPLDGDSARGLLSGDATIRVWAEINGCGDGLERGTVPDTVDDGRVVRWERFRGCGDDGKMLLYVVERAGHFWPIGDMDPALEIGGLFLRHRR